MLFFGRFLINIHKIPAKFSCLLIFRWGAMLEHPNLVPFAVLLPAASRAVMMLHNHPITKYSKIHLQTFILLYYKHTCPAPRQAHTGRRRLHRASQHFSINGRQAPTHGQTAATTSGRLVWLGATTEKKEKIYSAHFPSHV